MQRDPDRLAPPPAPLGARPRRLLGLGATLLVAGVLPAWAFDRPRPAAREEAFLAACLLVSVASGLLAPARGVALVAPALMVGVAFRLRLRHEHFVESEAGVQFLVTHLLLGGVATLAAGHAREAVTRRGPAGQGPERGPG